MLSSYDTSVRFKFQLMDDWRPQFSPPVTMSYVGHRAGFHKSKNTVKVNLYKQVKSCVLCF